MTIRYLTPFAFLALLPVGGWFGGTWTFMAGLATPLCLASLDAVLGEDETVSGTASLHAARWLPRIYVLLQLCATTWAAAMVARPSTSALEAAGLAISAGFTTGVFGFVAAHELIHSQDRRDRALGLALLGTVFYMHFRIAHVYGHHRRAATFSDPATARLGEGLYAFLARSITGQFCEAWMFEARRRYRSHPGVFGASNRMVGYITIELLFLLALALASLRAFYFFLGVAIIAVILLESFNYIAHYGLRRRTRTNGRPEPIAALHSWNSSRWMNNASLFNMGKHSDHHRRTTRPYPCLVELTGSAELPSGYTAALLLALVPSLWRNVMDPRAEAVMSRP